LEVEDAFEEEQNESLNVDSGALKSDKGKKVESSN